MDQAHLGVCDQVQFDEDQNKKSRSSSIMQLEYEAHYYQRKHNGG